MKFLQKIRKGRKGFTLIELLVVIAILGVIAAVAVPNILSFMGSGTVEAANSERANVQTAIAAHMAASNLTDFDGSVGPTSTTGPALYILNPAGLQATYTVVDGAITAATPLATGKWKSLTYTAAGGWAKS